MADAVWPGSLPTAPLLRGLSERPPDLTVRSKMDVGPDKVRARATVGVRVFPCELLLTAAQVATFDAFFYTTLAGGALEFDWLHPRTGDAVEFRFVGPPEYAPRGPRSTAVSKWDVRFTLELIPSADAIVIGGGGGGTDPPTGGAWFQLPNESAQDDGESAAPEPWIGELVFEDPAAPPDGLLWQFGAEDEFAGSVAGDSIDTVPLAADDGPGGIPIGGTGSASGAGEGGSLPGTGVGGVIGA